MTFPGGDKFNTTIPASLWVNHNEAAKLHCLLKAIKGPLGEKYHISKRRWSAKMWDWHGSLDGPCVASYTWGHNDEEENVLEINKEVIFTVS